MASKGSARTASSAFGPLTVSDGEQTVRVEPPSS